MCILILGILHIIIGICYFRALGRKLRQSDNVGKKIFFRFERGVVLAVVIATALFVLFIIAGIILAVIVMIAQALLANPGILI